MPPKKSGDMSTSKLSNTDGEGIYTGARMGGIPAVVEQIATHLTDFEHHLLIPSSLPSRLFLRPTEWKGKIAVEKRDSLSIHFFPNHGEITDLEYVEYTFKGILEREYDDFNFDVVVTHIAPDDLNIVGVEKQCRWINVTHGGMLLGPFEELIDNHWMMSEWQKTKYEDNTKSVVIPMPIDEELFKTGDEVKDNDIVWHGRIAHEKRIIPLSHLLADTVPDKTLHIIGGPDHHYTEEWGGEIESGLFGENSILHGRLFDEDLATELRKHRYYVLPSKYETFCVALLEALSCGCEPLCIRHPALEWASPYVRFYDSLEEMAEALATLDEEPYEAHCEGIHNTHSWRVLEPRLSALFAGSPSECEVDDSYAQACMDDDGGLTNH